MTIETLVNCGVIAGVGYGLVQWMNSGERTTDPWGPDIEQHVHDPQTPALCLRCLIPQRDDAWFCPECGSAVGPYNTYMPFVLIFSEGEALRAGVNDKFRPSFFIVCGFVVYALAQYAVFAPIYWYFLYQNFRRNHGGAGNENVQET
jgi:hypothetical protein